MSGWNVLTTLGAASLLVSAAIAEPPSTTKGTDKTGTQATIDAVLAAHNRERAAAKLPPLSLDSKLNVAAHAHATDMAGHGTMTHEGSDGSSPAERIKRQGYVCQSSAENVAEGYRTVDDLMRGWMDSPHHRENILGKYTQVGIAVVRDDDDKPYWCVNFAAPIPKLDPSRAGDDLIEILNKARSDANLPALKSRPKLTAAAAKLAKEYASGDTLDLKERSQDLIGLLKKSGYRYQKLAESTASGQPGAREVAGTLMDSPTHKEHILGDFTEIGVGYAVSESGKPYWCMVLARPLSR
jgi:uncharacterized protein YkwD